MKRVLVTTAHRGVFAGEIEDDRTAWDTKGLQSWAMSRFQVKLPQSQIRKMTYQGVEEKEIRILYYLDSGIVDVGTSRGDESRPQNVYVDLLAEPEPDESDDDDDDP